jgi:hypothetical protein
MRVKHLAAKNKMAKGKATNAAMSWVPSAFMQKELDKAKADDLISNNDSIIFPGTERILKPKSGYREKQRGTNHGSEVFYLTFYRVLLNRRVLLANVGL